MCSECWYSVGHASGCPNKLEPEPVEICSICGEGIFEGDKYYNGPEELICECCIDDLSVRDFMELVGEELSVAGEKEE